MTFETVNGLGKRRINKVGHIHQKCVTADKNVVERLYQKTNPNVVSKVDNNVGDAIDDLFNTMSIKYKDNESIKKM